VPDQLTDNRWLKAGWTEIDPNQPPAAQVPVTPAASEQQQWANWPVDQSQTQQPVAAPLSPQQQQQQWHDIGKAQAELEAVPEPGPEPSTREPDQWEQSGWEPVTSKEQLVGAEPPTMEYGPGGSGHRGWRNMKRGSVYIDPYGQVRVRDPYLRQKGDIGRLEEEQDRPAANNKGQYFQDMEYDPKKLWGDKPAENTDLKYWQEQQRAKTFAKILKEEKAKEGKAINYWSRRAPITGSLFDAGKAYQLTGAVEAMKKGTAGESDYRLVAQYIAQQERYKAKGRWGKIGDIVSHAPAFMAEFIGTGTIFKAGMKGATRGAIAGLSKVGARGAAKAMFAHGAHWAPKLGGKVAAGLVGGIPLQTIANPQHILKNVSQRRIPKIALTKDEMKQMGQIMASEVDESFMTSMMKGGLDSYIEMASEHFGASFRYLPEIARVTAFKEALKATMISRRLRSTFGNMGALGRVFKKGGFHGVGEEMAEEWVGDAARGLTGVREDYGKPGKLIKYGPFSKELWDDMLPELIAFSIIGGAARVGPKTTDNPYQFSAEFPQAALDLPDNPTRSDLRKQGVIFGKDLKNSAEERRKFAEHAKANAREVLLQRQVEAAEKLAEREAEVAEEVPEQVAPEPVPQQVPEQQVPQPGQVQDPGSLRETMPPAAETPVPQPGPIQGEVGYPEGYRQPWGGMTAEQDVQRREANARDFPDFTEPFPQSPTEAPQVLPPGLQEQQPQPEPVQPARNVSAGPPAAEGAIHPRIGTKDVRKLAAGRKVDELEGNAGWRVNTAGGKFFDILVSDMGDMTEVEWQAVERQVGRELTPQERQQGVGTRGMIGMVVEGQAPIHGVAIIKISKQLAGVDTLEHEVVHFLRKGGMVTQQEWNSLVKKYSDKSKEDWEQEEDVADAFPKWRSSKPASRARKFLERVLKTFGLIDDSGESVFKAMGETGVWSRTPDRSQKPVQPGTEKSPGNTDGYMQPDGWEYNPDSDTPYTKRGSDGKLWMIGGKGRKWFVDTPIKTVGPHETDPNTVEYGSLKEAKRAMELLQRASASRDASKKLAASDLSDVFGVDIGPTHTTQAGTTLQDPAHASRVAQEIEAIAGKEQSEAVMQIANARAEQWAKENNRPADEFFEKITAKRSGEVDESGDVLYHPAWHGSPSHQAFPQFLLDHVGEGEGNQTYGWGLYFADAEAVGRSYKEGLSRGREQPMEKLREYYTPGRIIRGRGGYDRVLAFHEGKGGRWSVDVEEVEREGFQQITPEMKEMGFKGTSEWMAVEGGRKRLLSPHPEAKNMKDAGVEPYSGLLYKVELAPEQKDYLLWDKPLDGQSKKVRTALQGTSAPIITDHQAMSKDLDDLNERANSLARRHHDLLARGGEEYGTEGIAIRKEWDEVEEGMHDLRRRSRTAGLIPVMGQVPRLSKPGITPLPRYTADGGVTNRAGGSSVLEKGSGPVRFDLPTGKAIYQSIARELYVAPQMWAAYEVVDGEKNAVGAGRSEDDAREDAKRYFEQNVEGQEVGKWLSSLVVEETEEEFEGYEESKWSPKQASLHLLDHGIRGIKYFDQASRHTSGGEATFNYVIFDHADIVISDILEQRRGGEKRGAVEFTKDNQAILHAFESSDVSTLVHELGHIFRRSLPKNLMERASAELKQDGIVWSEEAEEQFASGFERYLRDGKAPSSALKKVFAKFKEWLKAIYKAIKGTPLAKKVSPNLKSVFDAMLVGETRTTEKGTTLEPKTVEPANQTWVDRIKSVARAPEIPKDATPSDIHAVARRLGFDGVVTDAPKYLEEYEGNVSRVLDKLEQSPILESEAEDGDVAILNHLSQTEYVLRGPIRSQSEESGYYIPEVELAVVLQQEFPAATNEHIDAAQRAVVAEIEERDWGKKPRAVIFAHYLDPAQWEVSEDTGFLELVGAEEEAKPEPKSESKPVKKAKAKPAKKPKLSPAAQELIERRATARERQKDVRFFDLLKKDARSIKGGKSDATVKLTRPGEAKVQDQVDVSGELVEGTVLIHPDMEWNGTENQWVPTKKFQMTHVPTKSGIGYVGTRSEVKQHLAFMKRMGADFSKIKKLKDIDSGLLSKMQRVNSSWQTDSLQHLEEAEREEMYSHVGAKETDVDADIILDADDLGATGGLRLKETGAELVKTLSKDVPEFSYNPVFTVSAAKKLVFRDGYTYELEPEAFNLHEDELTAGQTIGINLEDLGIKRATPQQVVVGVLKDAGFIRVSRFKGGIKAVWATSKPVIAWTGQKPARTGDTVKVWGSGESWTVQGQGGVAQTKAREAVEKIKWKQPAQEESDHPQSDEQAMESPHYPERIHNIYADIRKAEEAETDEQSDADQYFAGDSQSGAQITPDGPTVNLREPDNNKAPYSSHHDIIKTMSIWFDVPIFENYISNRKALAVFKVAPEIIRRRNKASGDIMIHAHEVGHVLDKRTNIVSSAPTDARVSLRDLDYDQRVKVVLKNGSEVRGVYRSGNTDSIVVAVQDAGKNWIDTTIARSDIGNFRSIGRRIHEGFAEFVRLYWSNPDYLGRNYPAFSAHFQDWIEKNPEMGKKIKDMQGHTLNWISAGFEKRVDDQMWWGDWWTSKMPRELGQTTFDWGVQKAGGMTRSLYTALKDENDVLRVFENERRKRGGKKLKPGETAKEVAEVMNYTGPSNARQAIEGEVFSPRNNQPIGPTFEQLVKREVIDNEMTAEHAQQLFDALEIDEDINKVEIESVNMRGIHKVLGWSRKKYRKWSEFAASLQAIEMWNKTDAKGNATPVQPGITLEDATQFVEKYDNPVWRQAALDLKKFNDAMTFASAHAGVISLLEAKRIVDSHNNYVPMYRQIDQSQKIPKSIGGAKLFSSTQLFKRRHGSGNRIIDPMVSTIRKTIKMYSRSNEVYLTKTIADQALHTGMKGPGGFVHELQPKNVPTQFNVSEIWPSIEKIMLENGISQEDLENMDPDSLTQTLNIWRPDLFNNGADPVLLLYDTASQYETDEDGNITGLKKMKPHLFWFRPDLYEAVKRTDQAVLPNVVGKVFSAITTTFRAGAVTMSPAFAVGNALVDWITFQVQREEDIPEYILDIIKTDAADRTPEEDLQYTDFLRGNASTSFLARERILSTGLGRSMYRAVGRGKAWVRPIQAILSYAWSEANFMAGLEQDVLVAQYKAAGGELAHFQGLDRNLAKVIMSDLRSINDSRLKSLAGNVTNAMLRPGDTIRQFIGLSEVASRFAEFTQSLRNQGWDRARIAKEGAVPKAVLITAARAAADVTVNFSRMGTIGRKINRAVPFWNARWEGVDKAVRTVRRGKQFAIPIPYGRKNEDTGSRETQWMNIMSQELFWRLAQTIIPIGLAYWFMYKDDDWRKEQPVWQDGHWIFPDENGQTKYRLKMPYEWSYLLRIITSVLDATQENDPEAMSELEKELGFDGPISDFGEGFFKDMFPMPRVAVVHPLFEVAANKDTFTGRPIETRTMLTENREDRYTDRTSELAKKMAGYVGLSPVQLDHLLEGYSGGMTSRLSRAAAGVGKRFKGEKVPASESISQNLISSAVTLKQNYTRTDREFYKRMKKVEQEMNSAEKHGKDATDMTRRFSEMKRYATLIADIRKSAKGIKDRDDRFAIMRHVTGIAREAMGKKPLKLYPTPWAGGTVAGKVTRPVEKYIGTLVRTFTAPPYKRKAGEAMARYEKRRKERELKSQWALQILKRTGLSPEELAGLYTGHIKKGAGSTRRFGDRGITAFGRRINQLLRVKFE